MTSYLRVLILLLVSSLLFRIIISPAIYSGDVNNHVGWGQSIFKSGFSGAYDREYTGIMQPTYPPLSIYAFTTSTSLYSLIYKLAWSLNNSLSLFPSQIIWILEDQDVLPAFNKVIAMVSDVGIGLLIFRLVRYYFPVKRKLALIAAAAYLYNPAVWFNSALWGQIESFPLFFILLALWLMLTKKSLLSHAAFVGALLAKQSSIIFIPVFIILSWRTLGFKPTLKGIFLQIFLFYFSFLPFFNQVNLLWPFQVYLNRLQTGSGSNFITDHAFNTWIWLTHLQKIPDFTPVFGSISASVIGWLFFGLIVGLVLFIFILRKITYPRLFLALALLPLLSFVILTRMHERYSAPALPFLILIAAKYRSLWFVYIFVSLAHLANLYHNWWFPRIPVLVTWLTQWPTIELMALIFITSTFILLIKYLFFSPHDQE